MASSQIEIASSSPFGCVLKDHNSRRERRNSNQSPNPKTQSNFQRNLKELVRDHLHSCISIPTPSRGSNSEADENSNQNSASSSSCWPGGCGGGKRIHQLSNGNKYQKSKEKRNNDNNNDNQEAEEEVMALSSIPSSACSSMRERERERERETSPCPSDSDTSSADNFSVSSLVQKWREAEARNAGLVAQSQSPSGEPSPTRANSVVSESTSTIAEERQGNINNADEDDCQSCDNNKEQNQQEAESGDVDGGERERIRVADIVRKWAQTSSQAAVCDEGSNHNQQHHQQQQQNPIPFGGLTRLRIGLDHGGAGGMFGCPVLCSPKIRGRQAIADLFMRMEKERYKEVDSLASRHAVSKFPQRGRIQSVLKLRFLRREVSGEEQRPLLPPRSGDHQRRPPLPRRRPPLPKPIESNKEQTVSTITNLREKFVTATEQDSTNNATTSTQRDDIKNTQEGEQTSTSKTNQPSEHISSHQEHFSIQSCTIETSASNQGVEVTIKCNQQTCPEEDLNIKTHQTETTDNNVNVEMTVEESQQEARNYREENNSELQLHTSEDDSVQNTIVTQVIEQLREDIWGDNNYDGGVVNLEKQDSAMMSYSGWEEEEEEEMEEASSQGFLEEPNLDWIADIARPRSYWEDRRQAWYQEVFTTRSQDEEIRQLLERGSVSAVLASDFRDRMDRLVMCSVQRVIHPTADNEQEEDQSMRAILDRCLPSFINHNNQEEEQQVVQEQHVQEQMEDVGQEDREGKEEDEEQNIVDDHAEEDDDDDDIDNFYDPTPSPTQFQWDHFQDHEVSDDSDNAPSTSLQQPSPLPSFDRETRASSPFKNSSIEMELIYDMRAHMEQLYQEMSELRKSIATCMEMQIKLQHSIKEEVSAAFNNPKKREKAKDSNRKRPKKGNCCICYEKKVDSLLYRCGHMCTCFNCAHELQWSSGKCPICRAQIIDVVRAYPDN